MFTDPYLYARARQEEMQAALRKATLQGKAVKVVTPARAVLPTVYERVPATGTKSQTEAA